MDVIEFGLLAVVRATFAAVPVFLLVLATTGLGRKWLAPWARQTLWSLVLIRLVLPISVVSPASLQPGALWLWNLSAEGVELSNREQVLNAFEPMDGAEVQYLPATQPSPDEEFVIVPAAPDSNWAEVVFTAILPIVVLAGMLLVAVWTIITTVRLRRWVRSGTECQQADWLALLAEGQRLFGVKGGVTLLTIPKLTSPATCGWWRPAILLPEDAATWSMTELRHVLWHELAHIRRHDVASNWGLALVRVLHWWNPMFWWAQRSWLSERELACDALVLRHLDDSNPSEYGKTILRFLERLTRGDRDLSISVAPGFVLFLGRTRAVRRRLEQLSSLARPEGAWRRRIALAVIAMLGLSSLTDAARHEPQQPLTTEVELPEGTTWNYVTFDDPDHDAPRTVIVYDLSETITRLREEDPSLTIESGVNALRQDLQGMLCTDPMTGAPLPNHPASTCVVKDNQLVVNATTAQQDAVRKLLNQWNKHGQRQVSIDVKLLTIAMSLKDLPGSGGVVLNVGQQPDPNFNAFASDAWSQHSVPAFIQKLNPEETTSFVQRQQADRRSNVVSAPKITIFDGLAATIQCGGRRPFVTGLRSRDDGSYEPQISIVVDGYRLHLRSQLSDDQKATQLHIQFQQSEILDVEVFTVQTKGKSASVQIPHVSRSVVTSTNSIPLGHTLLIAPLRRDSHGNLHVCLIRPELVQ